MVSTDREIREAKAALTTLKNIVRSVEVANRKRSVKGSTAEDIGEERDVS